jgi:CubicO group peptidase (beta-lactamase class C family)
MSLDALLAATKALVDDGRTPACQVAVARDGDLLAFETFGGATNGQRFSIFSATKPIVASLIWQLIGDGMIDTEQRVCDHIPEFAANGKAEVTIEQVLLHTGGFPSARIPHEDAVERAQRVAAMSSWPLEWEPGSRFEYHPQSAHWVLAELIERSTGTDFRDAIEQHITAPLGLPRLLGIAAADQGDIVDDVPMDDGAEANDMTWANTALVRELGIPGGGGIMTAATLARFYQALLRNPDGLWDTDVLDDGRTNVRCTFSDPMMGAPVNRTIGLVLAGDDGMHQLRYAMFGKACSPRAFGHAGAHAQVAWADPATGISFAYLQNAMWSDPIAEAIPVMRLADLAADLH